MSEKIRLTIRKTAEARGIKKPFHLANETGISTSMAKALWDGERYPDLRTLWKIAKALNCDLGDLVRFVGTKNGTKASRSGQS